MISRRESGLQKPGYVPLYPSCSVLIDNESFSQYSFPEAKFLQDINQHWQDIDHWKTKLRTNPHKYFGTCG
jgi:hypothetical protein